MGAEVSQTIRGHKMSPECVVFCEAFEPYCHKTDESTHLRASQFAILDGNHNGHASLAECMKWIGDILNNFSPERGPDLFRYFYPSYIRAHAGAAIAGFDQAKRVGGTATAREGDYLQKREFRLFCASLCFHAIMLDYFHILDGFTMQLNRDATTGKYKTAEGEDNDRRISIAEWRTSYAKMAASPFVALKECAAQSDADASFRMIDSNGKGFILFTEFCAFVKAGEVQDKTDIGFILAFDAQRDFVPTPGFVPPSKQAGGKKP